MFVCFLKESIIKHLSEKLVYSDTNRLTNEIPDITLVMLIFIQFAQYSVYTYLRF